MGVAVLAFALALTLESGDTALFAVICVATGAAMGADLTLLPAAFATRMAKIAPNAAEGFGLWALVSKLSLAFAAVALRRCHVTNGPHSYLVGLIFKRWTRHQRASPRDEAFALRSLLLFFGSASSFCAPTRNNAKKTQDNERCCGCCD